MFESGKLTKFNIKDFGLVVTWLYDAKVLDLTDGPTYSLIYKHIKEKKHMMDFKNKFLILRMLSKAYGHFWD